MRVDYAGVSGSIRIAKGVRLRLGSVAPQRVTTTELTEVGRGTAYVTSARIILAGSPQNKAIRLASLIGIEAFRDGAGLEPASGRRTILVYDGVSDERAEYVTTLLSEVLARA